jgi:hypothetical protein
VGPPRHCAARGPLRAAFARLTRRHCRTQVSKEVRELEETLRMRETHHQDNLKAYAEVAPDCSRRLTTLASGVYHVAANVRRCSVYILIPARPC